MDLPSLGILETNSIALGIEAADVMLKAAEVTLIVSHPISPGKYITVLQGENGPVETAIEEGKWHAGTTVVDATIIPRVHSDVLASITGTLDVEAISAAGVLETFSCATLVRAADAAAKEADVRIVVIRLGVGLGGKAYFVLTGMVGPVRDAMRKAENVARDAGLFHTAVVIPQPHGELRQVIEQQ